MTGQFEHLENLFNWNKHGTQGKHEFIQDGSRYTMYIQKNKDKWFWHITKKPNRINSLFPMSAFEDEKDDALIKLIEHYNIIMKVIEI